MDSNQCLENALEQAMRSNGIAQADQYAEALQAFNNAFAEIVTETVRFLVFDQKAKVPLLTQVFNTDKSTEDFPLPYTTEVDVSGDQSNRLASTAFYRKNAETSSFSTASASSDDCETVCKVTSGGRVRCYQICP